MSTNILRIAIIIITIISVIIISYRAVAGARRKLFLFAETESFRVEVLSFISDVRPMYTRRTCIYYIVAARNRQTPLERHLAFKDVIPTGCVCVCV